MKDFQRISRSTLNSGINPELLGPLTRMAYHKIREGMATLDQFIIHVKGVWKRKDLTPEELEMIDEAWKKGNADVESGVKYGDEVDDVPKNDNLGESSLDEIDATNKNNVNGKTIYKGFSEAESAALDEAKDFFKSDIMKNLREAHKNGTPIEFKYNGRTIGYEPDLPTSEGYSAMTITPHQLDPVTLKPLGESGWYFGPRAFTSETELRKTILQELHRLNFSDVVKKVVQKLEVQKFQQKTRFNLLKMDGN